MKIQVLGSGCSKCEITERMVRETAQRLAIPVEIEKVKDMQRIAAMGVMRTPAVAIEGKVVHSGRVPTADEIGAWLGAAR
ncbi:MAG: thioredoxin family protein [Betaproteobacteria bacterium]